MLGDPTPSFLVGNNANFSGATFVMGHQATATNSSTNISSYGRGISDVDDCQYGASGNQYFGNTSNFIINGGDFSNVGGNLSTTANTYGSAGNVTQTNVINPNLPDRNQDKSNDKDNGNNNNQSGGASSSGNHYFQGASDFMMNGCAFSNIGGNLTNTTNNFQLSEVLHRTTSNQWE